MSKTNALETALLGLLFNGSAIANVADNAASSPLTSLYVSLHTGDPGEAGDQTTNECTYTSYARVAVARSGSGWVVTGNSVSPASSVTFPTATGGSETATYAGIGSSASGSGVLYYRGALSPTVSISSGVTPGIASLTIAED